MTRDKDKLILEHTKTKMTLADAKAKIEDFEDFIDGYKEQILVLNNIIKQKDDTIISMSEDYQTAK